MPGQTLLSKASAGKRKIPHKAKTLHPIRPWAPQGLQVILWKPFRHIMVTGSDFHDAKRTKSEFSLLSLKKVKICV